VMAARIQASQPPKHKVHLHVHSADSARDRIVYQPVVGATRPLSENGKRSFNGMPLTSAR
jgi:hypothetical protein